MVVYVEFVIFNNLFINYFILYLTLIIVKRNTKFYRVLLASSIGTAYAVALPFVEFNGDIFLKILLSLIMCLICVKFASIKKFVILIIAFLGLTFLLGGMVYSLKFMSSNLIKILTEVNSINLGLISLSGILILFITKQAIKLKNTISRSEKNEKKVILNVEKKKISKIGYYDSGNVLYYNSIYPVVVIDESIVLGNKAVGKLSVETVNGIDEKNVYKLESIIVDDNVYERVYGIYGKLTGKCKIILHSDLV